MATLKTVAAVRAIENQIINKRNLTKVANYIAERAKLYADFNAARKTKVGRNVEKEVDVVRGLVKVKFLEPHASFVEFGTEPHIIRPKNKGALSWIHSGLGGNVETKNGKTIRTGDRITVKEVKHPGTQPSPFVRPAVEDTKNALHQLLR